MNRLIKIIDYIITTFLSLVAGLVVAMDWLSPINSPIAVSVFYYEPHPAMINYTHYVFSLLILLVISLAYIQKYYKPTYWIKGFSLAVIIAYLLLPLIC